MAINPIAFARTVNEQFLGYQLTSFPVTDEARRGAEAKAEATLRSMSLGELREALDLPQEALANRLQGKQPAVARRERHVHDVTAGEFVSVGVVGFSPGATSFGCPWTQR